MSIERDIMFGWKPGMGTRHKPVYDGIYGVREIPHHTESDPFSRKKMDATFMSLDDARGYLYRKIATWKGQPMTWVIYRFTKSKHEGIQTAMMYPTNRNKYGVIEINARFPLYDSDRGRWYVNRDGSLGKKIHMARAYY